MLAPVRGPPGRVRVGARAACVRFLRDGNERANAIASVTLGEVRPAMGTGY
jgi:hypothetical protein